MIGGKRYLKFIVSIAVVLLVLVNLASASPFAPASRYNPDHPNRLEILSDPSTSNYLDRILYSEAIDVYPCIDLDEYYAYADADPFDRFVRDDIKNNLNRLSYQDFNRVAAQNPYDSIDSNRFSLKNDFFCSTTNGYNAFADINPGDRFTRSSVPEMFNRDADEVFIFGDEVYYGDDFDDIFDDSDYSDAMAEVYGWMYN